MNILTVQDVAALLKVKVKTLYQWAEQKQIPSFKLNGAVRFDYDDVMRWVASCKKDRAAGYNPAIRLEARKGGRK